MMDKDGSETKQLSSNKSRRRNAVANQDDTSESSRPPRTRADPTGMLPSRTESALVHSSTTTSHKEDDDSAHQASQEEVQDDERERRDKTLRRQKRILVMVTVLFLVVVVLGALLLFNSNDAGDDRIMPASPSLSPSLLSSSLTSLPSVDGSTSFPTTLQTLTPVAQVTALPTATEITTSPPTLVFQSREELLSAVDQYLEHLDDMESELPPIGSWDISRIADLSGVFAVWRHPAVPLFNGDLSTWNTSSATKLNSLFSGASSFNQDLSTWDVSKVTSMSEMLYHAGSFDQGFSSWNTSNVEDMSGMFWGASSYNQDMSAWDVSRVSTMFTMFYDAESFDQALSSWNASNVVDMRSMFALASSYNHDISAWDVSGVSYFSNMFSGASAFNQNLCRWGDLLSMDTLASVYGVHGMFTFTSCPTEYDPGLPATLNLSPFNFSLGPFCYECS
jgi:surface protein